MSHIMTVCHQTGLSESTGNYLVRWSRLMQIRLASSGKHLLKATGFVDDNDRAIASVKWD
jgi:hypothetical protein